MDYKTERAPFYSIVGLKYFSQHPSLWLNPIILSLFLFFALILVFFMVLLFTWPHAQGVDWWVYVLHIFRSIGYSLAGVLVAFIIAIPILIALAIDRMVRKIYQIEGITFQAEGFLRSTFSTMATMLKTLFWRIFWPIIGILSSLLFGPIGIFIAAIGMGHLAAIDGCDLALSIQGLNAKKRMQAYHAHFRDIFFCGCIGGVLSLILCFTIVGWLIWIPAMFCGMAIWTLSWPESPINRKSS